MGPIHEWKFGARALSLDDSPLGAFTQDHTVQSEKTLTLPYTCVCLHHQSEDPSASIRNALEKGSDPSPEAAQCELHQNRSTVQ